MRRARRAAIVLAVAACGLAVAIAQAHPRHRHGPDLAAMTVQPSDLAPGAVLGAQGYGRPPRGYRAQYERSFRVARAPGGGPAFVLDTELVMAPSAALAARTVALQRALYDSRAGRGLLAATLVSALGSTHVSPGAVSVGRPESLGVGVGSFVVSASAPSAAGQPGAVFAELAVGPVAATLTFIDTSGAPSPTTVAALAGDVASHITLVLTSPIVAGTTGPTGATAPPVTAVPVGGTGAT